MGIGEIGERLRRSTVHIRSTDRRRQSAGSGVIWDDQGAILTNAHVIGSAAGHSVELWDGRSVPVELVDRDDIRDLAKLRVRAIDLTPVRARETAATRGEMVIAVGNPLGFTGALTTGVVHDLGPLAGLGRRPWVQAAIRLAPGNSGGPLADSSGQLLGINTMVVSGGIALAVPVATILQFLHGGAGPKLGVTVQEVSLRGGSGVGLLILKVERESPAEQASLLIGDILIGTREARFQTASDLGDAVSSGAEVLHLRFLRGFLRGFPRGFLRGNSPREREVSVALRARSATRAA